MAITVLTPPKVLDVYEFVSRKGLVNLGLNVAGLIANKKNVAFYLDDKEVLTGNLLKVQRITNALGLEAVILDGDFNETSKIMEHPIESGAMIADHKVINPVEIKVRLTMPFYDFEPIIKELREYYLSGTLLTVQSKVQTYTNMVVCDIPHIEAPENVSRITFNIRLRQALIVTPQYIKLPVENVKNAANADTLKSGQKQGTSPQTSVLKDITDAVKNYFTK